jgi:hypothetical protein
MNAEKNVAIKGFKKLKDVREIPGQARDDKEEVIMYAVLLVF